MDFKYLRDTRRKRALSFKQLFSVFFKSSIVFGLITFTVGYIINPYSWHEMKTMHHMNLYTEQVIGEVVDAWVVYEEDEESDAVYGYEYIFSNQKIGQYSGTSFGENYLKVGEKRLIEYRPTNPFYNRMEGMRVNPNDSWNIYLVLIAGVMGSGLFFLGIWSFVKNKMYLERGVLTLGYQISRHETSGENGPTTHYTYTFDDREGNNWTIKKSGKKIGYLEEEEQMVYLPECPEKAKIVRTCGSRNFKINNLGGEHYDRKQVYQYLKNHPKKRNIEWKTLISVYFKSFVIFGFGFLIYAIITSPVSFKSLFTGILVSDNSDSAVAYVQEVWLAQGSDKKGGVLYGHAYQFWIGEVGPYTGISYGSSKYEKYDEVKVFFSSALPRFNKLEGMTTSRGQWSVTALYTYAFFLGLGIILIQTKSFLNKKRFLERGTLAMAERVYFEDFTVEEGKMVYRADYQFRDINDKEQKVRLEHGHEDFLPEKTQLIYLPEIPEKAQSVAWLAARYLIK